jgi:hypothetical protein
MQADDGTWGEHDHGHDGGDGAPPVIGRHHERHHDR